MVHLVTQLSKYIMIILFAIYAYYSYVVLLAKKEQTERRMYKNQVKCMLLIHLLAFTVLFAQSQDYRMIILCAAVFILIGAIFLLYKKIYKGCAVLVVNHMCMLMIIGFIMLARLDFDSAERQFGIACLAVLLSAFVPLIIKKFKFLKKFTWLYAVAGILALGIVFTLGQITGGAYLSVTIAGISFQPSEFVKIIFVFYTACSLNRSTEFKNVCITTLVAAVHVLILVASTDLGAALIFFITYVVMLYTATGKPLYFFGGLGAGAAAAVLAAKVFTHVQTRIEAWKDPFANIYGSGYQVAMSLFAIGTGGWFGLGLYQGMPETIPVVTSDFIFSAIAEELGVIFAICVVLVCFGCFLMFLNIAMQIQDEFYKLIALGLGCVYGTQVFLNIGGVIKLIPSTGVTLPLISYGGSSILCTIIMFAVIQGLYIIRHDEVMPDEKSKTGAKKAKKQGKGSDRGNGSGSGNRTGSRRKTEPDYEEIW